jgi:hypothetical protein
LRLVHQRPRDHHLLGLAAGEQVGLDVAPRLEAELRQQLVGTRLRRGRRDAVAGGVEGQVAAAKRSYRVLRQLVSRSSRRPRQ